MQANNIDVYSLMIESCSQYDFIPCRQHGETPRVRVLEEHSEGRALRGRANGRPERARMEAAEPQTWRRALLHAHATRSGVPQRRQLPPREPLQRSQPGGPTPHHTGGCLASVNTTYHSSRGSIFSCLTGDNTGMSRDTSGISRDLSVGLLSGSLPLASFRNH